MDFSLPRLFPRAKAAARLDVGSPTYWLQGGSATPLAVKSSGLHGDGLERMARSRRELGADKVSLALAYTSNPVVHRCVNLCAQSVAEMPHGVRNRRTKAVIPDHPLNAALDTSQSYYRKNLLFAWVAGMKTHGEAYIEKVRSGLGEVAALRWLNPVYVEPLVIGGRITQYLFTDGEVGYYELPAGSVIYDYTHNPLDDFRGLSPLQVAITDINIHNNYREYLNAFFRNDATPGGILAAKQGATIGKPDQQRMKEWIDANLKGARNRFKLMFLPAPMEFQSVQQSPAPEYGEVERSATRAICTALGVPVPLVDLDQERFQLGEQIPKSFYENTVIPDCEGLAPLVNREFLPLFGDPDTEEFYFDYDKVLALMDDQVKRATALNARWLAGNATMNEVREKFGDAPVNGGDVYMMPKASTPVPLSDLPRLAELARDAGAGNARDMPEEQTVPRQGSADRQATGTDAVKAADLELRAWQRKALRHGVKKARAFRAETLPVTVADAVRADLSALPDDADKAALKAVFDGARRALKALVDRDDALALVDWLLDLDLTDLVDAAA